MNSSKYSSIGLTLVLGIALYWYLGKLADIYFETKMVFQMLGIGLGIFAGIYKMFKVVQEINETFKKK